MGPGTASSAIPASASNDTSAVYRNPQSTFRNAGRGQQPMNSASSHVLPPPPPPRGPDGGRPIPGAPGTALSAGPKMSRSGQKLDDRLLILDLDTFSGS